MNDQINVDPGIKPKGKFPLKLLVFGILVAAALIGIRLYQKKEAGAKLVKETEDLAVTHVSVVSPQRGEGHVKIILPGTVQAFTEAPIYARTDGYLKKWYSDIGARVKKGDLLAEIDAPEVDQELNQAKAALLQAQADYQLSKTTADRWNKMFEHDAVSKQEVDQKNADLAAKQAALAASDANVKRLQELQAFEKIYAPFDGIVTSRKVDVGTLVSEGSASSVQELFTLAQINVLRIYVNVPERYSSYITPDTSATIEFASKVGQLVKGKVVRTANAIDPQSLTLLTEIDIANDKGEFLPGGYAQVHIDIDVPNPPLLIPANTLIFRSEGTQVGIVGSDNKVKLLKIKVQRDFGTKLEIDGLTENDRVILNPSDSLRDGQSVQVVAPNEGQ